MRDVSFKVSTKRTARASAVLHAAPATISMIRNGQVPKGDPLPVAKVAAVQGAKKTAEWIPYCHNIPIELVRVDFDVRDDRIDVEVEIISVAKTGVEMEALTAAAAAVLNLYDMLKMLDEEMEIGSIRLLEKTGGKSDLAATAGWSGAILTISDRAFQGLYEDQSGPILARAMHDHGSQDPVQVQILPDEPDQIASAVESLVEAGTELVFLTGGTGAGPRDVTVRAIEPLIETRLPGIERAYQQYGQDRFRLAMLGRCMAGIVGSTVVIAIPGSPSACEDAVCALFPPILHLFQVLRGDGHP